MNDLLLVSIITSDIKIVWKLQRFKLGAKMKMTIFDKCYTNVSVLKLADDGESDTGRKTVLT